MEPLVLNPALEVIITPESDSVLLKNHQTGKLKLIGNREWSIIQACAEDRLTELYQLFQADYMHRVIAKGLEMQILCPANQVNQTDSSAPPTTWLGKVGAWVSRVSGGRIRFDMRGDFSMFRVFTLRLHKGNLFESLRLPWVAATYGVLLLSLLVLMLVAPTTLRETFFTVSNRVTHQIALFVVLTFFSSYVVGMIHEMGHYIIYKSMGGQSNQIGFALKFLVMPTLYVNTDTVHLWKKRWKRILVSFGGSIMDATVGLIIVVLIRHQGLNFPNAAFFGYMMLISVTIKLIFNLNFFVHGTDGYFILSDLLGRNNIQKTAQAAKNQLWSAVRQGNLAALRSMRGENWVGVGYFAVGFMFKCLSIFLTIYSFIFIGSTLIKF
ncbi:M50 family metallopeptidase [Fibrella sp. WM1]|uniref:M50 family metallopeptidase n=1 Tax=Fibrella musci TaxID=3242485 RepID=UPI0035214B03